MRFWLVYLYARFVAPLITRLRRKPHQNVMQEISGGVFLLHDEKTTKYDTARAAISAAQAGDTVIFRSKTSP